MPSKEYIQWKSFDNRRWGYLPSARRQARKALADQVKPVLDMLKEYGVKRTHDNFIVDKEILRPFYDRLYRNVGIPFARVQYEQLQGKIDKQDQDEWAMRVQNYLGIAISDRLDAVSETTRHTIARVLTRGIQEGATIDDMASRIASQAGGMTRATRIARTEIISASNLGSIEGAKSTGLPLRKTWLAARQPDRTRPDHLEADGQTVDMEELFNVGGSQLSFPGDWDHGADVSQLVNCRCTVTYEVKRD